jgi:pimeloyl-ACP methyl ester carboxylesterase
MPLQEIEAGGMRLNYQDVGAGPTTVVLLHGFPFNSDLWRPQIPALAERHRVIAPDLRGFGASQLSAEPYTIARLADDVAELLDALGLGRAVIGGLSMGGYVAFEFFQRHRRRAAALVFADTRPDPDSPEAQADRARMAELARSRGSRAVVDELLPKLLSPWTRAQKPEVERVLREMMGAANPEAIAAALMAMAARADSRPLLPQIQVPTLVVGGTQDSLTPAEQLLEWGRQIPGARVELIEAAGHVSNLERPEAFNALLLDFLSSFASTWAQSPRGTL